MIHIFCFQLCHFFNVKMFDSWLNLPALLTSYPSYVFFNVVHKFFLVIVNFLSGKYLKLQ